MPSCGGIDKTTHHIVICPNVEATHSYEDAVLQFEEKLHKVETYPSIINTMALTLFGEENSKFEDNVGEDNEYETDSLHNTVHAAAKEQDNASWHNFLEGKSPPNGESRKNSSIGRTQNNVNMARLGPPK